jgi:uncharacterized SAM-binding protein YcdF (DUF218 family)
VFELLKESLRLSSVAVWLPVMTVGAALAWWRRSRPVARVYIVAVLLGYWLLATPAVAERLASMTAGGYGSLERAGDARGASEVVVLGGGSNTFQAGGLAVEEPSVGTAFRVIEAARVYRLLDRPTVILMGGTPARHEAGALPESDAMGAAADRLGIPVDHLVLENRSQTTREQALAVKRMFAGREGRPFVLVTSPTHIARAMSAFRAVGLAPIASASALESDGRRASRWWPNDTALLVSDEVFYDVAARVYYWSRGWLGR